MLSEQPFYCLGDKLSFNLKALENSCYKLGHQTQYHSLAATSTSLSQVSDDSNDCVSLMGDMLLDSSSFENLCAKPFRITQETD